jgi:plasmid stabilization system protein ParE
VKILRRAAREIREAVSWWRANRPAAPNLLEEELRAACELLGAQPLVGARATNAALGGVRRVHLSGARYDVYYRIRPRARRVEILATWHASRGRGPRL